MSAKRFIKDVLERCLAIFRLTMGKVVYPVSYLIPNRKKVVFSHERGLCYADNPRYISEKLHEMDPEVEQVWVESKKVDLDLPDYAHRVRLNSLAEIIQYMSAKVWVDSCSVSLYLNKKKNQYYINTWHGSFQIKKIGEDTHRSFYQRLLNSHSIGMVDLFISNTDIKTKIYRDTFKYKGEILECGYPKNDFLFLNQDETRKKVLETYGLSEDTKIVLYAPTFRTGGNDWMNLDFDEVLNSVNKRWTGKWVVLARLHPLMMSEGNSYFKESDFLKDATLYPNMQELIAIADIFITDYSSGIYDFSLLRRPCFLYASDYDEYRSTRGLYWDLEKDLPYSFAQNMVELKNDIETFDEVLFEEKLTEFFEMVGIKENGKAADTIANLIIDKVYGEK